MVLNQYNDLDTRIYEDDKYILQHLPRYIQFLSPQRDFMNDVV